MQRIITPTGQKISLADWQAVNKLPKNKAATYFTISELDCENELMIAAPLLTLLDAFRQGIDKPVKINSGYRSQAKQDALKAQGYKTATFSPHVVGMAADIDTANFSQTQEYVRVLRDIAQRLNINIRLGYKQYANIGQSFIHVDVCPMYYAAGKPYHKESHPAVWEKQIEW